MVNFSKYRNTITIILVITLAIFAYFTFRKKTPQQKFAEIKNNSIQLDTKCTWCDPLSNIKQKGLRNKDGDCVPVKKTKEE